MLKSYGKIDDYTALGNIDRNEGDNKEEYDSKYSEEELKQLESQKQEPRNSLRCKDNYRRAHRKVRKSHKATVL